MGPYPQTLEEFVRDEMGSVMRQLHVFSLQSLECEREDTPDSVKLADGIREYVDSVLSADEPPVFSFPEELKVVARWKLENILLKDVIDEYIRQYQKERREFLLECLQGKTVVCTSLSGLGFPLQDAKDETSGSDTSKTIVGRIVDVDPSQARLCVVTVEDLQEFKHWVDLWRIDWESGEITQMAEVQILPD